MYAVVWFACHSSCVLSKKSLWVFAGVLMFTHSIAVPHIHISFGYTPFLAPSGAQGVSLSARPSFRPAPSALKH